MPIIRVLHIVDDLDVRGQAFSLLDMLSCLDRNQFQPQVCCLGTGGTLIGKLADRNIPYHILTCNAWWSLPSIWQLTLHIRELGCHIVHCHGAAAGLCGRLGAVWAGTPVLCGHSWSEAPRASGLHRRLSRWLDQRTDRMFFASHELQEQWHDAGGEVGRAEVFHALIDETAYRDDTSSAAMKAELGVPADGAVVGMVDRFVSEEACDIFLKTARQLVREDPFVNFLVVGDGPLRQQMERRLPEMELSRNVVFCGYRSDMPRVYRAMDTLLVTGRFSGVPRVVLEGMASGVPVVVPNRGGLPELLADGGGYLVPHPTPEALAAAVEHALDADNRARVLAQASRTVARYSACRKMTELEDQYIELCETKQAFRHFY